MNRTKTILLIMLSIAFIGMIYSMFVNDEYSEWINRAVSLIIVFVMIMIIRMNKNK